MPKVKKTTKPAGKSILAEFNCRPFVVRLRRIPFVAPEPEADKNNNYEIANSFLSKKGAAKTNGLAKDVASENKKKPLKRKRDVLSAETPEIFANDTCGASGSINASRKKTNLANERKRDDSVGDKQIAEKRKRTAEPQQIANNVDTTESARALRANRRIKIKEEAKSNDQVEIVPAEINLPTMRKSDIAPTEKVKIKKKRADPLASFKKRELFKLNSLVFAKQKGYRHWPARIIEILKSGYWVHFFGTGQVGRIYLNGLHLYGIETMNQLTKNRDGFKMSEQFKDGLNEIAQAYANENNE